MHVRGENRRWENCPSLSLIPSVCLRQLVITKATHCCRGKPWGRTHRERERERGRMERLWKERKRAINEEERQHRYDQRLSASPSSHLTEDGQGVGGAMSELKGGKVSRWYKSTVYVTGKCAELCVRTEFRSSQKSHPGAQWPATNGWLYETVTSVAVYRTSHSNYSLNWWRPASSEHNEVSTVMLSKSTGVLMINT